MAAAEASIPSNWRETWIDAGGVVLHAIEAGDAGAPLVVLQHGFPEFWFAWRRYIDPLAAAGFHVVALDQRGYNLSAKPPGVASYDVELLRKDIVSVIDALGATKASLMAHDWGAHVAWSVAEHFPHRVERLLAINAGHPAAMLRNVLTNPRQTLKSWYGIAFQLPRIPEILLSQNAYERLLNAMDWNGDDGPMTIDEKSAYLAAWSREGALTSMINWYRALSRNLPRSLVSDHHGSDTVAVGATRSISRRGRRPRQHRILHQRSIGVCRWNTLGPSRTTIARRPARRFVSHDGFALADSGRVGTGWHEAYERVNDRVDLVRRMVRVHHEPQSALARADCREHDRIDVKSCVAEPDGDARALCLIAHVDWEDWCARREQGNAGVIHSLDEIPLVLPKSSSPFGLVNHHLDRLEDRGGLVRRERRGKTERRTAEAKDLRDVRLTRHEPADRSVRLAQRPHLDDAWAFNPEILAGSSTGRAEDTGTMRVVDINDGVVLIGEVHHLA